MDISAERLSDQMRKLELLNSHITYRISKLAKLLEAEAMTRLAGTGINLNSYRLMMVVSIFEEITATDVSQLMVLDRAQVSRISADLIKRGLLQSRPDKSNKLKKLLSLTEEGHETYAGLRERFRDRRELIEAQLASNEMEAFWTSLEKVTQGLIDKLEQ